MNRPCTLPTEYSAIMTGEPYLLFEFRQVAKLRLMGLSNIEIRERVRQENLFQYKTNKSVDRTLTAVLRRLDILDDTLVALCVEGSLGTSRLVTLYGVAKTNLLFFEFLEEVFREKWLLGNELLTMKDLRIFFASKQQQSEKVASWSDKTVAKLSQVYLRTLQEAGLVTLDQPVMPPLVERSLKEHLVAMSEYRFLAIISEVM